jgi:hypothetical protein
MKPTIQQQDRHYENVHPGIASAESKYNCFDVLFTAVSSKKYVRIVIDGEA